MKEAYLRRGAVRPVGVVRELDADTHVSTLACGSAVHFDKHPAARRRTNMDQRTIVCAIGARIDVRHRLDEELDRYAAGRDPAVSFIDMQAIAVPDGAVMDHQSALASPRSGS